MRFAINAPCSSKATSQIWSASKEWWRTLICRTSDVRCEHSITSSLVLLLGSLALFFQKHNLYYSATSTWFFSSLLDIFWLLLLSVLYSGKYSTHSPEVEWSFLLSFGRVIVELVSSKHAKSLKMLCSGPHPLNGLFQVTTLIKSWSPQRRGRDSSDFWGFYPFSCTL